MGVGTICNGGLSALLDAQRTGAPFSFSTVKISQAVWNITGDETALPDVAWTVDAASVVQVALSASLLRTVVTLGLGVGNFTVGTLGLFSGGTLFALAAFPSAGLKTASAPPFTVGNIRNFYVDVQYASIASITVSPSASTANLQALVQALLVGTSGVVTARQLRRALVARGQLLAVEAAVVALPHTNLASVDWYAAAPASVGSALVLLISSTLGLTDGGAALVAAASAYPA